MIGISQAFGAPKKFFNSHQQSALPVLNCLFHILMTERTADVYGPLLSQDPQMLLTLPQLIKIQKSSICISLFNIVPFVPLCSKICTIKYIESTMG